MTGVSPLIVALLGGGLLSSIYTIVQGVRDRRAKAALAPAERDSLVATAAATLLSSAQAALLTCEARVATLQAQIDTLLKGHK